MLLRQFAFSASMLGGALSLLSTFIFLCQVVLVQPLQKACGADLTCAIGILSKATALNPKP